MTHDTLYQSPRRAEDFAFGWDVAQAFDDMVARSVPGYAKAQQLICQLVLDLAPRPGVVHDLGCATGATLAVLAESCEDDALRLVGVDKSEDMVAAARCKLSAAKRCVEIMCADLLTFEPAEPAVAHILNLTLQFIRPLDRPSLIGRLRESLQPGGLLILYEKTVDHHALLNRWLIQQHYEFKSRSRYTQLEIAQKREALENVLIPFTTEENTRLLLDAGFGSVSLLAKDLNFAVFAAMA